MSEGGTWVVRAGERLVSFGRYERLLNRFVTRRAALYAAVFGLCSAAFIARVALPTRSLNDDAVEYINVARHIAAGEGYLTSLKWHCFDSRPVVRPAWGERLPGGPVTLSAGLALAGTGGMKAVTAAISVGLIVLFTVFVAKDFSPKLTAAAALLLALNPNLAANAADFMSEVTFLPLVLAAMFLLGREKRGYGALATGALFGAAALTRYEGVLLFAVSFFFRPPGTRIRGALLSSAGFVAVMSPYWYVNYVHNGSPFYSLHFSQTWGADSAAYSRSLAALNAPTTPAFALGHLPDIVHNVLRNFYNYARELAGYKFLSLFAPFVLFAAPSPGQRKYLFAAGLVFLFYGFSWSAMNLERFMFVPYLFLLPFALTGFDNVLDKVWPTRTGVARAAKAVVCGAVLFLYAAGYYADVYREETNPVHEVPGYAAAVDFLSTRAGPGAAVMARDAWELNWTSGLPAAVLPYDADFEEAAAWGREIGVRYILAGPDEVPTTRKPAATFGDWRVYDLGR
jgi:4-amino-4-deoxy-L-arabinose transferase-like glycosyltransferase